MCWNVFHCAGKYIKYRVIFWNIVQCVAVCCIVLQCIVEAAHWYAFCAALLLQYTATQCNTLQHTALYFKKYPYIEYVYQHSGIRSAPRWFRIAACLLFGCSVHAVEILKWQITTQFTMKNNYKTNTWEILPLFAALPVRALALCEGEGRNSPNSICYSTCYVNLLRGWLLQNSTLIRSVSPARVRGPNVEIWNSHSVVNYHIK